MDLPPHTARQLQQALAAQSNLRRRIARAWILLGSLVVVFIGVMAVAHYGYGMPIHDRNTGELSTPANTLVMLLLIGGGGALFVVMGVMLNRRSPD